MVIGCVLGVIGGAAPFTESLAGAPLNWVLAGVGATLLIGAVAARTVESRAVARDSDGAGRGAPESAGEAIARTVPDLKTVLARANALPIAELAKEIDEVIVRCVYPVHEAQAQLVAAQGFARYAEHTGPWAAGERMLYRAWSAATDGHRPEALASLEESALHFEEAARAWSRS
jgi:hypothetical protein